MQAEGHPCCPTGPLELNSWLYSAFFQLKFVRIDDASQFPVTEESTGRLRQAILSKPLSTANCILFLNKSTSSKPLLLELRIKILSKFVLILLSSSALAGLGFGLVLLELNPPNLLAP